MAGKTIKSKECNYRDIAYDAHRRTLTFKSKGHTETVVFFGVPPEVFYGMPSGANVQNFIDLKLQGRYVMAVIKPPPVVAWSTINQTCTVYFDDRTCVWHRTADEPRAMSEHPDEAYEQFMVTFGLRVPDITRLNEAEETSEPADNPSL